jgi:hypothetical protein
MNFQDHAVLTASDHGGSPCPPTHHPRSLTALGHADPLRPAETPHLFAYLATLTEPRTRAGRRHPLVPILLLAAAAVLADAQSIAAIAEWAADAPQPVRAALGTPQRSPHRPLGMGGPS